MREAHPESKKTKHALVPLKNLAKALYAPYDF
jgi:hypothetical protein